MAAGTVTSDPTESGPTCALHISGASDVHGSPMDVWISDGKVVDATTGLPRFDASGLTVVPGFIDIQINGSFGHDFTTNPSSIWDVGTRLPEHGVTSFCPTIITAPEGRIAAAQEVLAARPDGYVGAEPIGLHVEGPFISSAQKGTHPLEHIIGVPPSSMDTSGIAIVTLAPELPGAPDFIASLVSSGITVSLGHSNATSEEAASALNAGARLGTHLFNAMAPITAREPGLAGVLLTDPRVYFGVIADRIHLSSQTLMLAWAAASDRLILITDATSATGMPDGTHVLGTSPVEVQNGQVRNAEGTLAGSMLTMDRAIRVLMDTTGTGLPDAIATATSHPADALCRSDLGSLEVGSRGDAVLLDGSSIVATVCAGTVAFDTDPDTSRDRP